jgi:PPK2 family polyphosphate:nucleotide phosphotransferase
MPLTPVDPSNVAALADDEAAPPPDAPRGEALAEATAALSARLGAAQALLTAEGKRAVLVVLQGRDASGKDGVVRHVFSACNPLGLRVTAFAAPSAAERAHDYLWRVHAACPPRGAVGIFNRSHYEDVLAARVRGLAPEAVWSRRYRHIAEFERTLVDEGTTVLKFFLHVSRAEQAERLRARLDEPDKNWKFDAGDLEDRMRWGAYTAAYRDALARTSADHAPWYVVPADKKKVRNYLVAGVLVAALERMAPRAPALPPEHLEAHRAALDALLAGEQGGARRPASGG